MAAITLLTPEEVAQRERKPPRRGRRGRQRSRERTRIIAAYKTAMRAAKPGDGADITLAPDEDKRKVRLNLKAAARELNLALDFRPIKDQTRMHLRFITPEEHAARPKRGGRPRKPLSTDVVAGDAVTAQPPVPATSEPAVVQAPPAIRKRRTRRSAASASAVDEATSPET